MNFPSGFLPYLEQVLPASELPLFLEAIEKEPTTSVRYNPLKPISKPESSRLPWSSLGYKLAQRPYFTSDPLFHGGAYYVQDASSQILEHVLKSHIDLTKPQRVLDLCAAPGGKSTHILSLLSPESLLVTNEVIARRSQILRENVIKWGYPNVLVTQKEAWQFGYLFEYFDMVLVDAPCSGEGLFRKDPGALEEWSLELVELSSQRQRKIVAEIWPTIRPGGHLIYSTCTYNRKENEENIEWIASEMGAEVLPIPIESNWNIHTSTIGDGNCVRFFPQDEGGEGFFVAILKKPLDSTEKSHTKKSAKTSVKEVMEKELDTMLECPAEFFLFEKDATVFAFPKQLREDLELLYQLSPLYAGVALAERKGKVLVPHYAAALSSTLNKNYVQQVSLTLEDAIKFLKKEPITAPGNDGYALVTYMDLPLGWIKIIGKRSNNLYPVEWRIRR